MIVVGVCAVAGNCEGVAEATETTSEAVHQER